MRGAVKSRVAAIVRRSRSPERQEHLRSGAGVRGRRRNGAAEPAVKRASPSAAEGDLAGASRRPCGWRQSLTSSLGCRLATRLWLRPSPPAGTSADRRLNGRARAFGQAVDRGASVRQPGRRCRQDLLRRRHHRGPDHRSVESGRDCSSSRATRRSSTRASRATCARSRRRSSVRYVLEGSVRRSGDEHARQCAADRRRDPAVTCGPTGTMASSRTSSALQDTITRNVVKALSVELTKDDSERVAKRGTENVQAYDVLAERVGALSASRRRTSSARDRRLQARGRARPELRARLGGPRGRALGYLYAILGTGVGTGYRATLQARTRRTVSREGDARPRRRSRTRSASAMLVHCAAARGSDRRSEARDGEPIRTMPTATSRWPTRSSFAGCCAEALEAVERAMRLNPHYPVELRRTSAASRSSGSNRLDEAASVAGDAPSSSTPTTTGRSGCCSRSTAAAGKRDDAARLVESMKRKRHARAVRHARIR